MEKISSQWHQIDIQSVAASLNVNIQTGLDDQSVRQLQEKHGLNRLTPPKSRCELMRFIMQFNQPLVYILLIASAITFYLDEKVDSLVIFGVVFINAIIGYLQEAKAEKAIDALSKMVTTQTTVLRNKVKVRIASEELVVGDVVFIQSGDKVPADLRLFNVKDIQIDESAMTGESVAVQKSENVLPAATVMSDRVNMAFASGLVTYGQAQGIVCAIGDQTEIGRIAQLTSNATEISTPLVKKIEQFSHILLYAILGLAVLTFFVGVLRGNSWIDMFMASVALAVGAIPEGLPAAVTITLAIGVSRMAKRRAIIRKLPAVEALGSTTVICSDKTGTLTENQMTVAQIFASNNSYQVTGQGYEPTGQILFKSQPASLERHEVLEETLLCGQLCNDSQVVQMKERWEVQGDPTEGALISASMKASLTKRRDMSLYRRVDMIPFESAYQYMAVLCETSHQGKRVIFIKGAVEKILTLCELIRTDSDGDKPFTNKDTILKESERMAEDGLRVLAFAKLEVDALMDNLKHEHVQKGLTFLGLQAMIDPPRASAIDAVAKCQQAGIKIKMITGDHVLTASAIAKRLGICTSSGNEAEAMTGAALERVSDKDLPEVVNRINVFARMVPEQKLRLVKALQSQGHVVAMTGDGVNDAPALKQADIGVAMGISGTDVAKGASDMLLTDDNFSSIEAAVEEGRCVYDNLTKFIIWTLPTNIGEAMLLLSAILMGLDLPALPVQLLWINMMTAILLGLMLVFEPKEKDIMKRKPRDPSQPILTNELIMRTGLVSLVILVGSYWLFSHAASLGQDLKQARTIVVNVIIMVETFYLLNCRSLTKSVFSIGIFTNLWVIGGMIGMVLVQLFFTYSPVMNKLFHSAPISAEAWVYIVLFALVAYVIVEIEKYVRFRFSKS